jgi:hypothetical protein
MSWTWLFVWNVSWLLFALVWLSVETKPTGGSLQGGRAVIAPYERHGFTASQAHEGTPLGGRTGCARHGSTATEWSRRIHPLRRSEMELPDVNLTVLAVPVLSSVAGNKP